MSECKQVLMDEEEHAWAGGENRGRKVNQSSGSNVLVVYGWNRQWKRKDPNDPQWLAHQTCWCCGKVGHICQRCMALQAERDAYCEKKMVGHDTSNAYAATDEPEIYAKVMVAEALDDTTFNEPAIAKTFDGHALMAHVIDEPEVYVGALIAEAVDDQALSIDGGSPEQKPWIIDSGCSANFSPNQSEFIEYTPYTSIHMIRLGDS